MQGIEKGGSGGREGSGWVVSEMRFVGGGGGGRGEGIGRLSGDGGWRQCGRKRLSMGGHDESQRLGGTVEKEGR